MRLRVRLHSGDKRHLRKSAHFSFRQCWFDRCVRWVWYSRSGRGLGLGEAVFLPPLLHTLSLLLLERWSTTDGSQKLCCVWLSLRPAKLAKLGWDSCLCPVSSVPSLGPLVEFGSNRGGPCSTLRVFAMIECLFARQWSEPGCCKRRV